MKSRWIIGFLLTCALAVPANSQKNSGVPSAEGPSASSAQQNSGDATNPATQLQAPAGSQDADSYPDRLEEVLGAMSAELSEIARAARGQDQPRSSGIPQRGTLLRCTDALPAPAYAVPAAAGQQSAAELRTGECFTPDSREVASLFLR